MKKYSIVLLLAVSCWLAVQAQEVIDEVVWVVGDEAILRSEVEEERLRAQYEGQPIPGDPYWYIPEQLAIQKLFLHQAELDSVEAMKTEAGQLKDKAAAAYEENKGVINQAIHYAKVGAGLLEGWLSH